MINSYDEIKNLLKKSRERRVGLLKEEEGRELTPQEQKKEEDDFRRAISDRVKFGKIRIYDSGGLPKVEWMGELVRERMEWVFSLDDTVGCYISADLLQLNVTACPFAKSNCNGVLNFVHISILCVTSINSPLLPIRRTCGCLSSLLPAQNETFTEVPSGLSII